MTHRAHFFLPSGLCLLFYPPSRTPNSCPPLSRLLLTPSLFSSHYAIPSFPVPSLNYRLLLGSNEPALLCRSSLPWVHFCLASHFLPNVPFVGLSPSSPTPHPASRGFSWLYLMVSHSSSQLAVCSSCTGVTPRFGFRNRPLVGSFASRSLLVLH